MPQKVEKHLGLHIGSKLSMMPSREAYKLLLVFNYRGFASRMSRANSDVKKSIEATWYNLGGDIDNLWKNINKGKDKKPFMCGKKCKDKVPSDAKIAANGVNDVEEYYYPSAFYDEPKLRNQSSNYWMLRHGADGISGAPVGQYTLTNTNPFGQSESSSAPLYSVEAQAVTPTLMLLKKRKKKKVADFYAASGITPESGLKISGYEPIKAESTCWFNCVDGATTVACVAATAVPVILALSGLISQIIARPDEKDELGDSPTAAIDNSVPIPNNTITPTIITQQHSDTSSSTGHTAAIVVAVVVGGVLLTALTFSILKK